jgi:hypothetical protein
MGTGMPCWGPIFTEDEIDALITSFINSRWKNKQLPNWHDLSGLF